VFEILTAAAAVIAAGIASIAGFGIGSVLTPLLAMRMEMSLAVAAVSIPHMIATAVRCWLMRKHIDRRVLIRFGILSAAGGLLGAILQSRVSNRFLEAILAGLLIFVGTSSLGGFSGRMRLAPRVGWLAGILSGLLGGMVGNQGGIRSAALMGFHLNRQAFVATATGAGLIVDSARFPFYLARYSQELLDWWRLITLLSAGVLIGTIFGAKLLRQIPEHSFQKIVGTLVLSLGIYMLVRAI
jgi:uncharacterized protein